MANMVGTIHLIKTNWTAQRLLRNHQRSVVLPVTMGPTTTQPSSRVSNATNGPNHDTGSNQQDQCAKVEQADFTGGDTISCNKVKSVEPRMEEKVESKVHSLAKNATKPDEHEMGASYGVAGVYHDATGEFQPAESFFLARLHALMDSDDDVVWIQ
jgi:hypothetical protein